jgi:type II secretory pathway pseudopilin PulG
MSLSRRMQADEGETLIEILITIIVMSIAGVAVVAAMTSAVLGADAHRSLATGEVALRDYTEAAVAQASTLNAAAKPCPAVADLTPPAGTYSLTPGWSGLIAAVEYWIPGAGGAAGSWGTQSACTTYVTNLCGTAPSAPAPAAACSPGSVRLTVKVDNPNLTEVSTKTMQGSVVVRRSNGP